ncbi:MAG: hypothetical protein IKY78_00790 [Clostridia bacterium]|nr:hypothetical protein [Clostridia bacterium]
MDKYELWENFIKSGKVADYLKYRRASFFEDYTETAEEIYSDDPNLEDFNYDAQDGRYNNP